MLKIEDFKIEDLLPKKYIKKNEQYCGKWEITNLMIEMETSLIYNVVCKGVHNSQQNKLQHVDSDDIEYVLKFLSFESYEKSQYEHLETLVREEVEIHNKCYEIGISPEIIEAWICEKGGVIIMTKLQQTVGSLLREYRSNTIKIRIITEVLLLMDKMHSQKIFHGDTHEENFMVSYCKQDNKVFINEKDKYESMKYRFYVIDLGSTHDANYKDDHIIFAGSLPYYFSRKSIHLVKSFYLKLNILTNEEMIRIFDKKVRSFNFKDYNNNVDNNITVDNSMVPSE